MAGMRISLHTDWNRNRCRNENKGGKVYSNYDMQGMNLMKGTVSPFKKPGSHFATMEGVNHYLNAYLVFLLSY